MMFDADSRPKLRPLEAHPLEDGDGQTTFVLRDPTRLAEAALRVSPEALYVLSMLDGQRTCAEIVRASEARLGDALSGEVLDDMVKQLDASHLLEGPTFEAYYDAQVEGYRAAADRPPTEAIQDNDQLPELLASILSNGDVSPRPGHVNGLIAPHLDYPRGAPCYGAAYGALKDRPVPDRVVVLGTNHFGRSSSVVATGKDFRTPLGTTPVDQVFLSELERRVGDLRRFELDHAAEHSVELQVCFLQHVFGSDRFAFVPFLCPNPCGPTGTAPMDGEGVDLADFAEALRDLIEQDGGDTLIVAGADFSHVGAYFDDDCELDDAFLESVRRRDARALGAVERGDAEAFLACVADEDNPTRMCSAGCIYALLRASDDAEAHLLHYHQAVTREMENCVTSAAAVLTRR